MLFAGLVCRLLYIPNHRERGLGTAASTAYAGIHQAQQPQQQHQWEQQRHLSTAKVAADADADAVTAPATASTAAGTTHGQ